MIYDVTLGVRSAVAGINTRVVDARIVSCALVVRYALGRDLRCDQKYHNMRKSCYVYVYT